MRLDSKETFPSGMQEYLNIYGWHFSKKMCDWATSNMYKTVSGAKRYIVPIEKEAVDNLLANHNISLRNSKGYDYVYIANMVLADFMGSSIKGELEQAKYIRDVIDDPDGYDGLPFTRFYADCIGSGTPIMWEDMI
jgi:hypothetical protein